jgi:ABC-2 type transport system ATP-binding protein
VAHPNELHRALRVLSNVVEVEDLEKFYGKKCAVAGISFSVSSGEIVALLGPNGAGKTTTIEILEGLRRRDAGRVLVLGRDPERRDRRLSTYVGVVPQSTGIDGELTVSETLRLYASFYKPRRSVDGLMDEVGLIDCEGVRLSELSGGQRRRVDLALALVGDPCFLFLDEPTTGLDPAARRSTWHVISKLREQGVAVLLTSQYLEEVQQLADRVIVMRSGAIVANNAPESIVGPSGQVAIVSFHIDADEILPAGPWQRVPSERGSVELITEQPTEALRVLTAWATGRGSELAGLEVRHRSLEERYLELTADP